MLTKEVLPQSLILIGDILDGHDKKAETNAPIHAIKKKPTDIFLKFQPIIGKLRPK